MAHLITFRVLLLILLGTFCLSASAQTCKSQNSKSSHFNSCIDLPYLNAYLYWTYSASLGSATIAFRATPAASGGWIAWGINPTGTGMIGTLALVGYVDSATSMVKAYSTSIQSQFPSMGAENLSTYSNLTGESSGGEIILYANVVLPQSGNSTVNQVWQIGNFVVNGVPLMHKLSPPNLRSFGPLNFLSG